MKITGFVKGAAALAVCSLLFFACETPVSGGPSSAPPEENPEKPPVDPGNPDKPPVDPGQPDIPPGPTGAAVPEDALGYAPGQFRDWFFKVSFDRKNIPAYVFADLAGDGHNHVWIEGDATQGEEHYAAHKDDDNKAQGFSIDPLTVYRYNGFNPLMKDNADYNADPFLQRFSFYYIDGKAGISVLQVSLKQYLIAVDTHSKFVFAYGKVTDTTKEMGQEVPAAFEAVELHEGKRPFWEYDPIGYVKPDGTVTLYQHYTDEYGAAPTEYFPAVHEGFSKPAGYGAGDYAQPARSPYYPEK